MTQRIQALWNGEINPQERGPCNTKKICEVCREWGKLEEALLKTFSEEQRIMWEKIEQFRQRHITLLRPKSLFMPSKWAQE